MSHFAEINSNSIVQRVIVAEQDFINSGKVGDSFLWIQCSYNHNFRKQYAGIGYKYDKANDVFISPQPYPSWTLDASFDWQPPIAIPSGGWRRSVQRKGGEGKPYEWDEENTQWTEYN